MTKINLESAYNQAEDAIAVTATRAEDDFLICSFAIYAETIHTTSVQNICEFLPVINNAEFLARAVLALHAATDAETDIPMCVDTSFEIA